VTEGSAIIDEIDVDGASVLIVGATGGLGSRIAGLLAGRGARLTLVGRSADRVDALDVPGAKLTLDLRFPSNVERAVASAVDAGGGLDVVVNAAGVVAFGPVADLSVDTVEELFLLNTFMPMVLARAALPHLRDGGVIVNVSAVVAERAQPGMAAYSASKAALTSFDAAFAREARRIGVRVIDVRPPHTETGLADHPIAGRAPSLPDGLDPDTVARRIVAGIADGGRALGSDAF
jgi:cyclic-di-GMP-binding biofilm dispersal mediator protein